MHIQQNPSISLYQISFVRLDYPYAVEAVVTSTMMSIITIPALLRLTQVLWQ
ncbi:hypothetical protein [Faecalicatena orotica]|uniref:hypothetical protein n=2 Tax=Bacillota TaxID=1239 RepID=UPI001FA9C96B|nr:hypothetical protein [Faecalicatena orotica]